MDKISEFFKELKDRFSNPLFFSFILGWLAINWKIVIGLIFYSLPQLQTDGYSSYQNLIIKESNFYNSFLVPFIIALAYTFLFPIFRNWINIFNAWNQKWGTQKVLNISKDGKISVSKYIQLREVYQKRQQTIEDVLEKESAYVEQNEELKNELNKSQAKCKTSEDEIQNIKYINDISIFMEGDWLFRIGTANDLTRVIIKKGDVYLNRDFTLGPHLYAIKHLAYNTHNYELIVIFEDITLHRKLLTEVFHSQSGLKVFKNNSNKGAIMEMRKED